MPDTPSDLKSALEARMGELAALLSEVAEALTSYPDELVIANDVVESDVALTPGEGVVINAREWPSIQEIEQLISNWRALTEVIEPRAVVSTGRRASR